MTTLSKPDVNVSEACSDATRTKRSRPKRYDGTALIGGSLLLIALAAITLVIGWIGADPPLIWVSIGASVVAAVLLALGYYRSKEDIAAQEKPTVQAGKGEVV